ncbi:4-coumarate--CoA ligase 1 [Ixodes scapularis]|uniref:4-coumarate--CoA ligase 1 n=1 Tax=Ixodes scapularis TaxID=6945 RepID=UPI001A9D5F54|nr:4-coumarate--CoA ligase 1 [Ixodes scapularis]
MAAALAVVFLGGTVVMTPTVYLPGELLYMIKDSGCNYLFADHKSAPKALEVNKDFYLKVVHLDSGEPLKAYERGEILAQGNNMMNGYYGKPEATNTAFTTDGWLRTGDLGYYDDTGRIYVVERLKQMIKVLDHHVTPAEIEELLLTHAAVAEVAVVGIPSQEHGETPVACVVLNKSHRRNSQTVETELMQLLTDNTTVHKHRFTSIAFWDSLPKTDTGKILRRELKIILSNLQSKEK